MRIATYNVHRCIGRDGVQAPQRIAEVLRSIDADVVALQEVAFGDSGPRNVLADLSHSLEARVVAGPTLKERKGRYGNAVLTRIDPQTIERLDISVPGREPRGAIALTLPLNGHTIRVVATHLGLFPGERRRQVRRLLPMVGDSAASVKILLGDFNEWLLWARPLRWISRHMGVAPAPATFPSHRPLLALDRIWVQPIRRLVLLQIMRHRAAAIASDHLPLVADLAI